MWRAAGFPLGSHTYSHMSLTANSAEAFEEDIRKNEPVLESLMAGNDWHWFRYPFLWEGDTFEKRRAIRAYLTANGYRVAQVTLEKMARGGVYDQQEIEQYEDTLESGVQDILEDLKRLTYANMTAEVDRFSAALRADLILPEDF